MIPRHRFASNALQDVPPAVPATHSHAVLASMEPISIEMSVLSAMIAALLAQELLLVASLVLQGTSSEVFSARPVPGTVSTALMEQLV